MLWITVIEWLARLIFLILIILSIWSVSIIIERRKFYKTLDIPFNEFKKNIRTKNFKELASQFFIGELFQELTPQKSSEQVEKIFDAFIIHKKNELEKGLPVLGTLGSTTPFIGLLGTIMGIIVSFGELSQGTGNTNSVMFSLAEALILTAVGLMVAIPAVISFNYYSRKVRLILNETAALKDLFIAYKD